MTAYFEWMAKIFAAATIVVGAFAIVALLMVAGMLIFSVIVRRASGYKVALWTVLAKRQNKITENAFFWLAFDDLGRDPWKAQQMVERAQKAVDKWDREHSES